MTKKNCRLIINPNDIGTTKNSGVLRLPAVCAQLGATDNRFRVNFRRIVSPNGARRRVFLENQSPFFVASPREKREKRRGTVTTFRYKQ
jgi:hypothetical protein